MIRHFHDRHRCRRVFIHCHHFARKALQEPHRQLFHEVVAKWETGERQRHQSASHPVHAGRTFRFHRKMQKQKTRRYAQQNEKHQAVLRTKQRDKHKTGGERTNDGADRVHRVQRARLLSQLAKTSRVYPDGHRKRRSHQKSRRQYDRERAQEILREILQWLRFQHIFLERERPEKQETGKRAQSYQHLEPAEHLERTS